MIEQEFVGRIPCLQVIIGGITRQLEFTLGHQQGIAVID
jgi:hypothetical protein